jgi:hypothetical protein
VAASESWGPSFFDVGSSLNGSNRAFARDPIAERAIAQRHKSPSFLRSARQLRRGSDDPRLADFGDR